MAALCRQAAARRSGLAGREGPGGCREVLAAFDASTIMQQTVGLCRLPQGPVDMQMQERCFNTGRLCTDCEATWSPTLSTDDDGAAGARGR